MGVDQGVSPIPTAVDDQGLHQQQLLRVKLSNYDAQLQNFAPIRDHVLASGGDPNKVYSEIQSRRMALAGELQPRQRRRSTVSTARAVQVAAKYNAIRLVDRFVNADLKAKPRMASIKNFAKLSSVGVPKLCCTTLGDRIPRSPTGHQRLTPIISPQLAIALALHEGYARCPVAHTAPKSVSTAEALIAAE